MAIEVETKDSSALSDTELADMADMCVDGPAGYEVGMLSKERDEWVLVTQARENGRLLGFSFSTLERIGGTPCLLWGLASIKRHSKREAALKAVLIDQFRRAVMAFPDEDVVVGTRFIDASGFSAFKGLQDVCPRPDHKNTGEERAWSRRLAKRFGYENKIDDRTFIITGRGVSVGVLDFETLKPEKIDPEVAAYFAPLDRERGDSLVAFGWAMAEDLASGKLGK